MPESVAGFLRLDLTVVFQCAIDLADAVASVDPSEWRGLPTQIEGPRSPHYQRWREWLRLLGLVEEECVRLKRSLGATGPLTAEDRTAAGHLAKGSDQSPTWAAYRQKFRDTEYSRTVRLALFKLATAAIDISGFATWQDPQWTMREQGLKLLAWGIAQLWDGLKADDRTAVRGHLQTAHRAIGWPSDPAVEPAYDGPNEIPPDDEYRVVEPTFGFVACPADYLANKQQASREQREREQNGLLRRLTVPQFVELAGQFVVKVDAIRDAHTTPESGLAILLSETDKVLDTLSRAKKILPARGWSNDALEQRKSLADVAHEILAWFRGTREVGRDPTEKDVETALSDFTRFTEKLREISSAERSAGTDRISEGNGQGKGRPAGKKRGRKPTSDPKQDKKLCDNWKAAKRQGMTREAFARQRGIKVQDLIDAQHREKYRRIRNAE